MTDFDIAVIGAGHAGCEAALAAARMGCRTLVCIINADTIGAMSCNPAIGGLAKGHLVKEIDALGGEMAKNIDATGIQFRRLNTSKGPAVRSSRAQADRLLYRLRMKHTLENQQNLAIRQAVVDEILVENGMVVGLRTSLDELIRVKAVVVATGTFLNGLIHIGLKNFPAGRMGDAPSTKLAQWFAATGFNVGRMKTGTTPRLDGNTIDYSRLEAQYTDEPPALFSFSSHGQPPLAQRPCHITYTNEQTHEIIRKSIHQSPMYAGIIEGIGARYCPSIEDKVMRFADRNQHQIFLEPEGLTSNEIYPNGISTSLPFDVQMQIVRSMQGMENAKIVRPGYAIEYDFFDPRDLKPTLESKFIQGLFFAGQINGTTGYEEAAAQGLLAGLNAARFSAEKEGWSPRRDQAYLGVLVDDLSTLGTKEPYRMFTSRAEYRLMLREDNADLRLTEMGRELGLVDDERWARFNQKLERIETERQRLKTSWVNPLAESAAEVNAHLTAPLSREASGEDLLRRPEMTYEQLVQMTPFAPGLDDAEAAEQVEIQVKYEGYIARQQDEIEKQQRNENTLLPAMLDYRQVTGLSNEVIAKLNDHKPVSIGQASRISGVTPAAISILLVWLKKQGMLRRSA